MIRSVPRWAPLLMALPAMVEVHPSTGGSSRVAAVSHGFIVECHAPSGEVHGSRQQPLAPAQSLLMHVAVPDRGVVTRVGLTLQTADERMILIVRSRHHIDLRPGVRQLGKHM